MPVINITLGPVTTEQKQQLIRRLTAEAMEITQIGAEHFTVLIHELGLENLGVGGKTVREIREGV